MCLFAVHETLVFGGVISTAETMLLEAVQAVEKETSWRHAIVSTGDAAAKTAAMQALARCQIQGTHLECVDIVASGPPVATVVATLNDAQGFGNGALMASAAVVDRACQTPANGVKPAGQTTAKDSALPQKRARDNVVANGGATPPTLAKRIRGDGAKEVCCDLRCRTHSKRPVHAANHVCQLALASGRLAVMSFSSSYTL